MRVPSFMPYLFIYCMTALGFMTYLLAYVTVKAPKLIETLAANM